MLSLRDWLIIDHYLASRLYPTFMFDFQKLTFYQKTAEFNLTVQALCKNIPDLDPVVKNQFKRAALSVLLNIAEGSSRFSKADRRNFLVIARGSVFECAAILDFLKLTNKSENLILNQAYEKTEEISRMLFAMIQNLTTTK